MIIIFNIKLKIQSTSDYCWQTEYWKCELLFYGSLFKNWNLTQARELKDTKIGVCCLSILEIEREVKIQRETERDRLFIIEYFHIGNGDWEVKMYAGNCKMEQILVADRVIFIGRFWQDSDEENLFSPRWRIDRKKKRKWERDLISELRFLMSRKQLMKLDSVGFAVNKIKSPLACHLKALGSISHQPHTRANILKIMQGFDIFEKLEDKENKEILIGPRYHHLLHWGWVSRVWILVTISILNLFKRL